MTFVQGDINGFGLRLLPLFDIVWTTGSTMFDSTHDDDMIEGCAILSITDKLDHKTVRSGYLPFSMPEKHSIAPFHHVQKSKLLFLKEKLTAKVAKDCNIVTHVLKANSTEQSILIECAKLAQRSSLVSIGRESRHSVVFLFLFFSFRIKSIIFVYFIPIVGDRNIQNNQPTNNDPKAERSAQNRTKTTVDHMDQTGRQQCIKNAKLVN